MMLSLRNGHNIHHALAVFQRRLAGRGAAAAILARVADALARHDGRADTPEHRVGAVALARAFGIATLDEAPAQAFSWDGRVIRTRTEASVIVHEIAHWLVSAPARRGVIDFGLGAGPESGRAVEADASRCMDEAACEHEEYQASLLGVILELELDQPGHLAFIEQNWLEGFERDSAADHFAAIAADLVSAGLIDREGRARMPPGWCVSLPSPRRACA